MCQKGNQKIIFYFLLTFTVKKCIVYSKHLIFRITVSKYFCLFLQYVIYSYILNIRHKTTVAIKMTLIEMYNDPTHILKGCEENDKILLIVNMIRKKKQRICSYPTFVLTSINFKIDYIFFVKLILSCFWKLYKFIQTL